MADSKAEVLTKVVALASQFSTCVEGFNLIFPSRESDHAQRVALARLGLQQGRLLIFGDAVGISSPPAHIATHMVPSHPGATNPDPHLPVNFGVRDARLDDPEINEKVRTALSEMAGRPSHLSRDDMMAKYGLKSPKRFSTIEHPALDTNRLEAFREKYGLLQDLLRQSGVRSGMITRRGLSMTMSHWTVREVSRFEAFVTTVREEVDGLISLLDVKDHVDRGMKTDIRSMGWHPDLSAPIVHQDWDKLKLIREACLRDYPEYVDVADTALKYINEELRGTHLAYLRAAYKPPAPSNEARPSFLSHFRLKSWSKSHKNQAERSKSLSGPTQDGLEPQRSLSESGPATSNGLEPVRSKSLSAIPDERAPLNLDSRLTEDVTHKTVPANDPFPHLPRLEASP
ncbi:prion-inhibition and propagation-domain-containing protein [Massariosphaeria phaeospora]|uniref:Prion-inhibition and propagation-domain-containing protein n=1 Tax=Massariosphaeria phaeospora TaxID=100035 RepID=A0A7C8IDC9_9PLEO|nr:prion-inhibition and propagation-domain-containing protein [Massariosphaeria phaeospora]